MKGKTKTHNVCQSFCSDESGVVAIVVALLLFVFFGIVALAVDVGLMMTAKNQSQNAADAGALAGARQMGENYVNSASPETNVDIVAQDAGKSNYVAGSALETDNLDIQIGTWNPTSKTFTSPATNPHAVRVEAKRQTGLSNGPISTVFAKVIGIDNYKMAAKAVASLSGTCTSDDTIPMGIGRSWFTNLHANNFCTQIALNDTMSSCAGWTNLSSEPYKQGDVQNILEGKVPWPKVHAGDSIEFGGGTVTPVLDDLIALFNDPNKFRDQKTFNANGTVATWTTSVVVYEDYGVCQNPVTHFTVLGFATVTINGFVTQGNNKGPYGTVQCNVIEDDRGGCFYAGTYGKIPGLVQ